MVNEYGIDKAVWGKKEKTGKTIFTTNNLSKGLLWAIFDYL